MNTKNTYYGNANPSLLEVVSPHARKICEFGCGAGALARAIKQKLGDVHYTGVELMAEQIELASDVLDVGLVKDLNQIADWGEDSEMREALRMAQFDHVIFGDVLEHLYDPARTLQQAAVCLRDGGTALVCMPNVQHWSVLAQLILGHWPQTDSGLFDRTHLRWFALKDMIALMGSAGLQVKQVIPRVFNPEKAHDFLEALAPAATLLGVQIKTLRQLSLPLQYVLVAEKKCLRASYSSEYQPIRP